MADVIPSEELRSLLLRLYATWEALDFDALREMVSAQSHALVVGTDPTEWWSGSNGLEMWLMQVQELGPVTIRSAGPVAYCCGTVGWIADRPVLTLQNGVTVHPRITAVAVIERGHWRFAQWHTSFGQTNEQSLGFSLTTSIDGIARSVRAERPDVRPASAPDGTVSIVFTDIESSTVLLERLGDTAFLRMLTWHDGIVRNASDEHRGYVVKSQGDGFMLAFPSAAFALRASLVMRDRIAEGFQGLAIRIRAGLHSGEAIRHDDDFYGRTVVIAARIGALALGGEILASDLVYALVCSLGTFTFGPPRTATLKGLAGVFEVRPVLN
jgi:class 3 adenylate cyclase